MSVGAKRDKEQQLSEWIDEPLSAYAGAERRGKPRIYVPFSARVRGVDDTGKTFEAYTHLDNLSAGGVYFRMAQPVLEGARLLIVTRLATDADKEKPAARIAIRVSVVRVEPQPDGMLEVAAKILQYRFLWQKD
jgi:hypothetical protein